MTTKTRLTLEEFLRMPDIEERRLELIDGEVHEKAARRWGDGALVGELGSARHSFGFVGLAGNPSQTVDARLRPKGA